MKAAPGAPGKQSPPPHLMATRCGAPFCGAAAIATHWRPGFHVRKGMQAICRTTEGRGGGEGVLCCQLGAAGKAEPVCPLRYVQVCSQARAGRCWCQHSQKGARLVAEEARVREVCVEVEGALLARGPGGGDSGVHVEGLQVRSGQAREVESRKQCARAGLIGCVKRWQGKPVAVGRAQEAPPPLLTGWLEQRRWRRWRWAGMA